jgi:FeS assembly SUF system protein
MQDDSNASFDFEPGRPAEGTAPLEPAAAPDTDPLLREAVLEAIRTVFDPEIPVNIVELGLIYDLEVRRGGDVRVDMTLTSPACPVAGNMPTDVEKAVRTVEGVSNVHVELVWTPPWNPSLMTEEAKLELGML